MLISKELNLGQPGTKRLISQYGARLMCVRYRYDPVQGKRAEPSNSFLKNLPGNHPPALSRTTRSFSFTLNSVKHIGATG